MKTRTFFLVLLTAFLIGPPRHVAAQSVSLNGSLNVASARDFATESFQDPWDMNERTDFGWFLHGSDLPAPHLSQVSFSNGLFHAVTGTNPNLHLLETGNPFAARLGKTGYVHPINADLYKLVAIRMFISGSPQAVFGWHKNDLWDGTGSTRTVQLTPGWRTYFVNLVDPGMSGPTPWEGLIRSLQFAPSYLTNYELYIDWIRLVNIDPLLCRNVSWSGLSSGQFDLYLSDPAGGTTPFSLIATAVSSGGESDGCNNTGGGYTFYAGALSPGTYRIIARRISDGQTFVSSAAYVVNAPPMIAITSPSEEGSDDDFATTQLGNPWDMNAVSDVETFFGVSSPSIAHIPAETPAGTPLGSTRVLHATSTAAQPGLVGDPIVQLVWPPGTLIDPNRYRILTVEFGMPDLARSVNEGSVARVVWRVAGSTQECVSDDIIFNSRAGANVLDKIVLDLADRTVLPLESGPGLSQLGWVPGSAASPGIDRFRFDPHEFSAPSAFYIRRVKLAALEQTAASSVYTIRWTATEAGTVTLYRDTDRNPSNGGQVQIGTASTAAGAGAFNWTVNAPAGEYFIYAVINDNQGNSNTAYSRWPLRVGAAGSTAPSAPQNPRILF